MARAAPSAGWLHRSPYCTAHLWLSLRCTPGPEGCPDRGLPPAGQHKQGQGSKSRGRDRQGQGEGERTVSVRGRGEAPVEGTPRGGRIFGWQQHHWRRAWQPGSATHLRDLGVQALPHLHAAVGHQHRAVCRPESRSQQGLVQQAGHGAACQPAMYRAPAPRVSWQGTPTHPPTHPPV